MLYEELQRLTRGLATYPQYEAINAVYMTANIDKRDAAMLWYLAYGRDTQLPPRTLEQKVSFAKGLPKLELNRLFWLVYESEKPLVFDEKTGLNYTLLIGNPTKAYPYHYLHLAIYHGVDVGTGNITVIPMAWRGFGNALPCWRSIKDKMLVKVKK